MSIARRWRIFYLVVVELAQKYTRALVLGFFLGLVLSLVTARLYPLLSQRWFAPIDRIGIVGSFSPNNLPFSIQRAISFGLTDLGVDGAPLPGLATSWVATDSGKTFTFYLRSDVKWQNNKPVVADDINYNIKNVTFQVIDNRTIRATLDNTYSPFPSLVAKPLFQPGLMGFGDYRVGSIRLNADTVSYLKLVPMDMRSREKKSLEYRFYPTEAAAILAYKLGEIDTLEELTSPYDLASWEGAEVTQKTKYSHIVSLFFNIKNSALADKAVRQALAYGVPDLPGERALSPITKTSWAYSDNVKKYTFDSSQMKKLLGETEIATSTATLALSTFPQFADEAQLIADSWTNLGVPTQVKIVGEIPSDYQVLLSVQEVPPDPDQYPFWHSTQEVTNKTGLTNVKIDKLLEDGRQELATAVRKKIYADFQRYLVEEAPAVFLHYQTVFTIRRK